MPTQSDRRALFLKPLVQALPQPGTPRTRGEKRPSGTPISLARPTLPRTTGTATTAGGRFTFRGRRTGFSPSRSTHSVRRRAKNARAQGLPRWPEGMKSTQGSRGRFRPQSGAAAIPGQRLAGFNLGGRESRCQPGGSPAKPQVTAYAMSAAASRWRAENDDGRSQCARRGEPTAPFCVSPRPDPRNETPTAKPH